jgi:membrane protease YdiL (CAAX protease family)
VTLRAELAGLAAVLGHGAAVTRLVPPPAYVPANLMAAAGAVTVARRAGVPLSAMGLERRSLRSGLAIGTVAAIPIALAVAGGVMLPATRRYFADERAIRGGSGYALYEGLLRIPLGTALAEEVIFRGALLGWLERRRGRRAAVALSSAVFGLWHVLPTFDGLRTNPVGSLTAGRPPRVAGAAALAVLTTAGAGWTFAWLRFRAGSVLAPAIAHASMNGFAFAAGRLLARQNGVGM